MKRIGSVGLAGLLAAAGYSLCGGFLQPIPHPFFVDPALPLNSSGTVQDWVGAVLLASQEWGANTSSPFRFAFAGFVAPPDAPGASVVALGVPPASCSSVVCMPTGYFSTCIEPQGPYDVSGAAPPGTYDLQGIATHTLGHALGLGHSAVFGATMSSGTGNALEWRDLHPDDIAGVNATYGAASPASSLLDYVGLPYTGSTVQVRLLGAAGPAAIGFDPSPGPSLLPGIGSVALGFSPGFVLLAASAPGSLPLPIPSSPPLIGARIHMQALNFSGAGLVLSNPYWVAIPY